MSALRHLLETSARLGEEGAPAALALVIGTEGSTYVRRGGMALFGDDLQVGWLSGGCLEPEIAARARQALRDSRLAWMEIDTRDDEDLLAGSALGCRGRLRLALLPLPSMPGWPALVRAWHARVGSLEWRLRADGDVSARVGDRRLRWRIDAEPLPWPSEGPMTATVPPPSAVAIFGAGPETAMLLPLLRQLGWITHLAERRPRWLPMAAAADHVVEASPGAAAAAIGEEAVDAALVMHHHFELDREALAALAGTGIGFIGLLGPVRRREDLFRVLPAAVRAQLEPRLHSPIGLDLGGSGPEAIALSIAAQLHAWRHRPAP